MTDNLSQNEVDLLFEAGAETDPAAVLDNTEVQLYDFRRPARISKDRMRSLQAMYGLLVKSIESWLAGRARGEVECELQSVEQITFGELVLALPSPCAAFIVDVPGEGRQGFVDFGQEFSFYLVDRLLGGTDRHEVPSRPLTTIERRVVQIAAEKVSGLLAEAWKDYVELDLTVSAFETIPEMLRVANEEDPVLVANVMVTDGDMSSLLMLALPFSTVEKFFTGGSQRRTEEPQGSPEERMVDRELIESTVRDTRIALGARLPEFRVPISVLAGLEPGALLSTGLAPDTELELYAVGQRRFIGAPGRVGRNLAVRIVDRVRPDPEFLIDAGRDTSPVN